MEGENNQLIWNAFAKQSTSFFLTLPNRIMAALKQFIICQPTLLNMCVWKAHGSLSRFPLRLCVVNTKINRSSNAVCGSA